MTNPIKTKRGHQSCDPEEGKFVPMQGTPSRIAIVAGEAPLCLTIASTSFAVSKFCGKGMPAFWTCEEHDSKIQQQATPGGLRHHPRHIFPYFCRKCSSNRGHDRSSSINLRHPFRTSIPQNQTSKCKIQLMASVEVFKLKTKPNIWCNVASELACQANASGLHDFVI